MTPANLLTQWAWLLCDSLAAAGISEVVVSPGSRSTPFVVAVHRHPQLRCWNLIDERCAAFFALGQARSSGRPSLLLCTSGSAATHYLPAVVEAKMSSTPLLILTADRPPELIDNGASQAIDQIKLFGDHVRHFVELGPPDACEEALLGLRRVAVQAVARSVWPAAGGVHLNARARKPLEPTTARSGGERELEARVRRLVAVPPPRVFAPRLEPDAGGLDAIAEACVSCERGLIVCGPGPPAQARLRVPVCGIADRLGYPLFAEAASQLRFGPPERGGAEILDGFSVLLQSAAFRQSFEPQLVLQIGRSPVTAGWERYLQDHPGCRRFVLSEDLWHDPSNSAEALLFADLGATLTALQGRLPERGASDWTRKLAAANRELRRVVVGITGGGAASETVEEGAAVREVVDGLPGGAVLALGNSLPIREVESWTAGIDKPLRVWSQRGASGIDGLVSGVAGGLSVLPPGDRPPLAVLLLGDVSLLHDLGGLAAARLVSDLPLAIVVLHNDGGRIFEQLPIFSNPALEPDVRAHFITSHGLGFASAAALYELPHHEVRRLDQLGAALGQARRRLGPTLIEVVVEPSSARLGHQCLVDRLERSLRELGAR